VSKTDLSVILVMRKTQQVASWSRDSVSRGAWCIRDSSGHLYYREFRYLKQFFLSVFIINSIFNLELFFSIIIFLCRLRLLSPKIFIINMQCTDS